MHESRPIVGSDADLQGWFSDAQLSSLLHENVDAFEAGAPFHDWGYSRAPEAASHTQKQLSATYSPHLPHCAGSCTFNGHHNSVESEAAHWGLFLINFTLHVLDTYGAPDKWAQSAQARSVAAFLFGLRSHQVRARAVCRALTCESAAHAAACTYDRAVNGCSGGRRSVALGP